ncbi:MAG: hypothetical protein SGPRY_009200, partial [Prymnesium sp.]
SPLAPGPAAGLLVATHFVYSMALKRKRAFSAFGWDLADRRNRSNPGGACFDRSDRGILFGHTFFDQLDQTKSILCSLPPEVRLPKDPTIRSHHIERQATLTSNETDMQILHVGLILTVTPL